jgi:pSer/pThr/pTyr-binding forkhead associated (FHA) protein
LEPPSLEGRSFVLGDDLILVRAAGCAATVDDGHVSQLHARVFRRGGRLLVEDLGPTNGTYLNRAKVTEPTIIRTVDLLRVGDTVLELS